CAVSVIVSIEGPGEVQKFALSQAHDLLTNPATFDPKGAFSRIGTFPPLERILLYLDGLRFQVLIAIPLTTRFFGLLMRTKVGVLFSEFGLLFSAYELIKYVHWSWDLLYCESCLQKGFLIAVGPPLSFIY